MVKKTKKTGKVSSPGSFLDSEDEKRAYLARKRVEMTNKDTNSLRLNDDEFKIEQNKIREEQIRDLIKHKGQTTAKEICTILKLNESNIYRYITAINSKDTNRILKKPIQQGKRGYYIYSYNFDKEPKPIILEEEPKPDEYPLPSIRKALLIYELMSGKTCTKSRKREILKEIANIVKTWIGEN